MPSLLAYSIPTSTYATYGKPQFCKTDIAYLEGSHQKPWPRSSCHARSCHERSYLGEVSRYQTGCYISSSEAASPFSAFQSKEDFLEQCTLAAHLKNGQTVYFTENNVFDKNQKPPYTTFLEFFICPK